MFTAFQPNAFQNDAFQIAIAPVVDTHDRGARSRRKARRQKYEEDLAAQKFAKEERKQVLAVLIDPPKALAIPKAISENTAKPALDTTKIELGLQKAEVLVKMQGLEAQHRAQRKMLDDDEDDATMLILLM